MVKLIKHILDTNRQPYKKKRTFTYFIPAPPNRKTGYQEKEFDHLSDYLVGKNFDIIDIKMESYSSESSSGVWILCILGAKTDEAANMKIDIDYSDLIDDSKEYIKTDPLIEHDH